MELVETLTFPKMMEASGPFIALATARAPIIVNSESILKVLKWAALLPNQ
jgi:hypothetical protein